MARVFGFTITPPWLILSIGQTEIDPINQLSQRIPLIHPLFLLVGALEDILLITRIGRMSLYPRERPQIEAISVPTCVAILGQVAKRPLLALVFPGLTYIPL